MAKKVREEYNQCNEFAFNFFTLFDIWLLLILKHICKSLQLKSGTSISDPFYKNCVH